MKVLFCLFALILTGAGLRAQYVYTINADSVKITNHCDTAELIIENHTQNVSGFLFNKGRGRTEFRKGLIKLNDSAYLIGLDTLKTLSPVMAWLTNGNMGMNPAVNFLGTLDTASLVFRTNNSESGRFAGNSGNLLLGTTYNSGEKLQVNGFTRTQGLNINLAADTIPITIHYNRTQNGPAIRFMDSSGTFEFARLTAGDLRYTDRTEGPGRGGIAFGCIAGNAARGASYVALGAGAISGEYINNVATGSYVIGIGDHALNSLTTGDDNIAIGASSLFTNSSGFGNVGVGSGTLALNTTGSNNAALGYSALSSNTGINNTAVGSAAGTRNTSGNNNVFVGANAGTTYTTGNNNTIIGASAGYVLGNGITGSGNVFIGYQAGYTEPGSNLLYIHNASTPSPLIYGDFNSRLLRANAVNFQVTGASFFGGAGTPTAKVHIAAGGNTVGSAPIKLTAGSVLLTPENGAIEYDGTDLYITRNATRYTLVKALSGQFATDFGAPDLAVYNTVTATFSVPGVQPGDVVAVNANAGTVNPPSIIITAYVTSANNVTIQAYNAGNSTVTLAPDIYKVRVIQ